MGHFQDSPAQYIYSQSTQSYVVNVFYFTIFAGMIEKSVISDSFGPAQTILGPVEGQGTTLIDLLGFYI